MCILMRLLPELLLDILAFLDRISLIKLHIAGSAVKQFFSAASVIQGMVYKLGLLIKGPSDICLRHLQVSTTKKGRTRKAAFLSELCLELDGSVNLKKMCMIHCNSNFEKLFSMIGIKRLQSLESVLIVKNGEVGGDHLKRIIVFGDKLVRLELLCFGVTYSVVDSLTEEQVSSMTHLRLNLGVGLKKSSLFGVLRKLTSSTEQLTKHFHLFDENEFLEFEFISCSCDRNDIYQRSVKAFENLSGKTLVLVGAPDCLDEIIVEFFFSNKNSKGNNIVMPWWGRNLHVLVWRVTPGVSPNVFQQVLKENTKLRSLELRFSMDVVLTVEDVINGLVNCFVLDYLVICYDVNLSGCDLLKIVGVVSSLRVMRIVYHSGITLTHISQMFIANSDLDMVLTHGCSHVSEMLSESTAVDIVVSTSGEWTTVMKNKKQSAGDGSLQSLEV